MAGVPSPSEMGKAEKFYEKIGDFVLQEDYTDEQVNEDGLLESVFVTYSIPLEIWESRTGMKFEFKEGDKVRTNWTVEMYARLKRGLYVQSSLNSEFKSPFNMSDGDYFASLDIEQTKNASLSAYFRIGKNKSIEIELQYYVDEEAVKPPSKSEIYTRINETMYRLKQEFYPEEEEKYAAPVDYVAPAPDVPVYVFFGHGDEYPVKFDEPGDKPDQIRSRLPEGITLITITECSTITLNKNDFIAKALKDMGQEKFSNVLRDPIGNKEDVRKIFNITDVNVYRTGDPYPKLYYHPINDQKGDVTKDRVSGDIISQKTIYGQSGVYKTPFEMKTFDTEWKRASDGHMYHYTEQPVKFDKDHIYRTVVKTYGDHNGDLHQYVREKIFKDSVWPPNWNTRPIGELKKGTPIEEVFKALGPGVYYWPICRSSTKYNPDAELVRAIRSESRSRHVTRGYGRKRKTYRKKKKSLKHHTRNNVHRF